MRRRLQFSLLGLLLLTSSIALGVKLWHGPHRERKILNPEEAALIFHQRGEYFNDWVLDQEYVNEWQGRRILSAIILPSSVPLYVSSFFDRAEYKKVVSVLTSARASDEGRNQNQHPDQIILAVPIIQKNRVHCNYFISDQGHLFRGAGDEPCMVYRTPLESVKESTLREQLKELINEQREKSIIASSEDSRP